MPKCLNVSRSNVIMRGLKFVVCGGDLVTLMVLYELQMLISGNVPSALMCLHGKWLNASHCNVLMVT